MTELTAKKLFNTLYKALDNNGFKEQVATFLIGQEANFLITDSDIAMNQLFYIAQNPSRSKSALYDLTNAISSYFIHASELSKRYGELLKSLYSTQEEIPDISLILDDEISAGSVDISKILNPPELPPFLEMVRMIRQNIEEPEDNELIASLISI